MKKNLLPLFLFTLSITSGNAQTVKEWTQQKKIQLECLIEQIAALQSYVQIVEKGYRITEKGLGTIQRVKKGDLALHGDFFAALNNVNPQVTRYGKVASIIVLQRQMLQLYQKERGILAQGSIKQALQTHYSEVAMGELLRGSAALVSDLTETVTNGLLQMNDQQRLTRIDNVYNAMQEQYAFFQHFCVDINLVNREQFHEAATCKTLRSLYAN